MKSTDFHPFLKNYESKHPTIKVNKEQTVSTFVMEKSYLLLRVDIDAETEAEAEANAQKDPEIVQVVYQGKQNTSAEFVYDGKQNEFVRKEEKVMFGFRTVSKPRVFYNVFMSDVDVDCFFYDYTSEPEW